MKEYDLLFQNGTLVYGSGTVQADVYVKGEKVAAVVEKGDPKLAEKTVDISGKFLLPGILDPHAHTDLTAYTDHFEDFVAGAACGGVTTILSMVRKRPELGLELVESLNKYIEDGTKSSYVDFTIHGGFIKGDDPVKLVPELVKMGITSFKMLMAYSARGFQLTDDVLIKTMDAIAHEGGVCMIHAENGSMIDFLEAKSRAAGKIGPEDFMATRPGIAEAEAVFRAYNLARAVGCPIYFVHQSARESIPVLLRAKMDNEIDVYAETCPQYLMVKNDAMLKWGNLAKIAPPLREQPDLDAMWLGCARGVIDAIGTDHAAYSRAAKHQDVPNIFTAIFGIDGIESILSTVHEKGVHEGKISISRMVKLLSENPARIFGLYPKKGTILPGSDADLVVFDPNYVHTIQKARHHTKVDYTIYEGIECHGGPVETYLRGKLICKDNELVGERGWGKFQPRAPRTGRVNLN